MLKIIKKLEFLKNCHKSRKNFAQALYLKDIVRFNLISVYKIQ